MPRVVVEMLEGLVTQVYADREDVEVLVVETRPSFVDQEFLVEIEPEAPVYPVYNKAEYKPETVQNYFNVSEKLIPK